ncbi:MAG: M28 family metallopeptidase [Nocardioidaceae bacterium]
MAHPRRPIHHPTSWAIAALVLAMLGTGCSPDSTDGDPATPTPSTRPAEATTASPTGTTTTIPGTTSATAPPTVEPPAPPAVFRAPRAIRTVRHLAGVIGPRHATSPAYAKAAGWSANRLRSLGYAVERQHFEVPSGNSWGVDVPAGTSQNIVATAADFSTSAPYLIVGAHLDTVPVAPGAEDNASGVSVVLELARLAAADDGGTRLPVVFVLFGAEEPRGPGDDDHHYGSRAYVAAMSPAQRQHLVAMVALDRVGVGTIVPVCTGGVSPLTVQRQLLRATTAEDVAASGCTDNQSSDHWSFEKAGFAAARVGSTPYAGYHSAGDVPSVVNPAQLRRAGTTMWTWLTN